MQKVEIARQLTAACQPQKGRVGTGRKAKIAIRLNVEEDRSSATDAPMKIVSQSPRHLGFDVARARTASARSAHSVAN